MSKTEWMKQAIELAHDNIVSHNGGPFGAIVVKDGQVIGKGTNQVTPTNDPTAHAEVQAIRAACQHLDSYQLTDCEIYTSCEPCPMCLGAIYWARPKAVYYYYTREEAAAIGFDDQLIYEEISRALEDRIIPMTKVEAQDAKDPFELWKNTEDKVEY